MTFAEQKELPASTRFAMVRITPGRYVVDDLTSSGSGIYAMSFPYPIQKVTRNGVELGHTTTTPVGSNDYYYHDEATGTFQVKLASAPSASNVIIVFYNLFYTSGEGISAPEDPSDSATTTRYWEPRVLDVPSLKSSFADTEFGVLTVSPADIVLANPDADFQQYLTDDDSLYNKDIKIWFCIDSIEHIQRVFTGKISSVPEVSDSRVRLSFYDQLSFLLQPAYCGDAYDECFHGTGVTPKDIGKPIPLVLARENYYERDHSSPNYTYALTRSIRGVCTDYTASVSTTTNRNWTLCRIAGSLATQVFGTLEAAEFNNVGLEAECRFSSMSNVKVGDTFSWSQGGNTYYGVIRRLYTHTFNGTSYNLTASTYGIYGFLGAGGITAASTVIPLNSIGVTVRDNSENINSSLIMVEHYTVAQTPTDGGNNTITITLEDDFEGSTIGLSGAAFSPTEDEVYFRLTTDTDVSHGAVLKRLAEYAGCETSAASFTAADVALDDDVAFSIPFIDESSYGNYAKYAGAILQSTLGYLAMNSDDELEYELLASPSGATAERDDSVVLERSLSCSIEYQDIITGLTPVNPHLPATESAGVPTTSESLKAKHLHGLSKTVELRHVLELNGNALNRADEILALRSNRKAVYRFRTATQDMDTALGDALVVTSDIALGGDGETDVRVQTVQKSLDGTQVEATDLLGL